MNSIFLFILSIFSVLVCAIIDNSFAAFFAGVFIMAVCAIMCQTVTKTCRMGAYKTLFLVLPVYIISAFIFSQSFDQNSFFAVSDSMRYLISYQNSMDYTIKIDYLYDTFFGFTDNNGLYNTYIQCWAAIGNRHLGGASVFYMTLAQTLFGVLCSVVLYRIISERYPKKAVKLTVTFSCCSLFLFYSSVIIRDIIVALFFLFALDYLTKEFKIRRFFLLILFAFIVWGVRLYSGLFYFIFPATYLILRITRGVGKRATMTMLVVLGLMVLPVVAVTALGEQTQAELEEYDEFSANRNVNGLFNKLSKLPPGAKQLALTLFSQLTPFPPHSILMSATTFSQFYMGLDCIVYEFFWFFVFYMLAYLCIVKGKHKTLSREELILLMIALLYIVANTAHPDIRRMMPVYPIIFLINLKVLDSCSEYEVVNAKRILRILYAALFIFAIIYRG